MSLDPDSPQPDPAPADKAPGASKPRADYHDHEDANKKEITIYSLGGVIDELTTSGFRNLNTLLVIAFQVSPLIVGFIGALKTIWDGIADPIVANWSDNCRSRFGRRRPFILAGGVVMAIVAWATWQFIPQNDKLLPNDPFVPAVQSADEPWKQLANLHLAYGVPDYTVRVQVEPDPSGKVDATMLQRFAEDSIKTLSKNSRAAVRLSENATAAESSKTPNFVLTIRPVSASAAIPPGGIGAEVPEPFDSVIETSLTGPGVTAPLVSRVEVRVSPEKVTKRERELIFAERVAEFVTGKPKESGVTIRTERADARFDVLSHRAAERANLAALRVAMMELFSRQFALPYDRVLKDEAGSVSDEGKAEIRETVRRLAAANPDSSIALFVSSGLKINPHDGISPEERTAIDEFRIRQANDETALARLFENVDIEGGASYHALNRNPLATGQFKGIWEKLGDGFNTFVNADPAQTKFLWFVLIAFFLMAFGSTLYNAAYYALGIEIAPSYNGRTLVVAYRSMANAVIGIVAAIFLPLSLLPVFTNAAQGSLFLVYVTAPIGLLLALFVFFGTKERTVLVRDKNKKPSFFRAVKEIGSTWEFWRITLLYIFMGYAIGSFGSLGNLLTIYYVFNGNLVIGASYGAVTGILGTVLATAAIPLFVILSNRLGKHNALRLALGSLAIGSIVKYFCYNPEIPELLFIPAFFYSPAIAGFYNVLSSMMGDVTDLDELRNGERREGMFGAVMSVIMKTLGSFTAIASGVVVVAAGFEIEKGIHQDPGVFHRMLILFSIVPGVASLVGFALLTRFQLTAEGVAAIKQQLAERREARAAANS